MKKIFGLLIGIIGLGSVFGQSSVDPMNLPKLDKYVTDFSHQIDQSSLDELNKLGEAYNKDTSNQLVAVLIPNRNGNELFTIGMNIFNTNKIGQAGKNNGLLLVIATEEKKIRIVVGYGLEGSMPDALASRIIEQDIRPLVNSGDFAGAIRRYYERSQQAIANGEGQQYQSNGSSSISLDNLKLGKDGDFFWIIGVVIGFILATSLKPKSKKRKWKKYIIFGLICLLVLLIIWVSVTILFGVFAGLFFGFTGFLPGRGGSGGFGGGGFGGGGGFSGGGGSSGGGGAGD